ncbi:MAG: hypothetical protein DWQ36_15210 [Acidobacteria bacterium]|nr:MAG: hypothetical protein DWQ30_07815 [Acidobacteriota bacterium]REK05856.1 MAG: hypothetical protein DWQ36_15210 [Acidobacteriota bacterium]
MTSLSAISLLLMLAAFGASASPPPGDEDTCSLPELTSLPAWFRAAAPLPGRLRPSCRLNPFFHRVDLDGDDRVDLALQVVDTTSGAAGITLVQRADLALTVLGAGEEFGNGGDDFAWLDGWSVLEADDPALDGLDFCGEALLLVKWEAASAFVGWTGDGHVWVQAGD